MLWQKLIGGTAAAAAPLTFVGGNALSSGASSQTPSYSLTGLTGGLASSPSAGDIVIVAVCFANATNRDILCTTSGYTEIADLFPASGTFRAQMGVFYKVLTTTETSVAFNLGVSTSSRCAIHVWRNPNATPFDAAATVTATGNTATPNPPSITTVTADAVVIVFGASAGSGDWASLTTPSGMENFFGNSTSSLGIGVASIGRPTTGAYDPPAFGGGGASDSSAAATIALRPK